MKKTKIRRKISDTNDDYFEPNLKRFMLNNPTIDLLKNTSEDQSDSQSEEPQDNQDDDQ